MRTLLITALALSLISCASLVQVNIKGSVGDEIRPDDGAADNNRTSAVIGTEAKFANGLKVSAKYRSRMTDFADGSDEHGFFVGVSMPVWTAKK